MIEAPHARFGLKSLPALKCGFMLAKWTRRLSILVAIAKTTAVSAALMAFAENTAVARGLAATICSGLSYVSTFFAMSRRAPAFDAET